MKMQCLHGGKSPQGVLWVIDLGKNRLAVVTDL